MIIDGSSSGVSDKPLQLIQQRIQCTGKVSERELARRRSSCVSYPMVSYETGYLVLLYKCGTPGRLTHESSFLKIDLLIYMCCRQRYNCYGKGNHNMRSKQDAAKRRKPTPCTENEELRAEHRTGLEEHYERRPHNNSGIIQQTDHINEEVDLLHEVAANDRCGEEQTGLPVLYRDYAALRDKYNTLIQHCANLQKRKTKQPRNGGRKGAYQGLASLS
jgi:hypothetical protein